MACRRPFLLRWGDEMTSLIVFYRREIYRAFLFCRLQRCLRMFHAIGSGHLYLKKEPSVLDRLHSHPFILLRRGAVFIHQADHVIDHHCFNIGIVQGVLLLWIILGVEKESAELVRVARGAGLDLHRL